MSMCLEFMPMSAAKIIERQNNPELICLIPSVCCAYWSKNTESESYYTKRKNSAGSLLISTREENLLPERQQINTYLKFTNTCAAMRTRANKLRESIRPKKRAGEAIRKMDPACSTILCLCVDCRLLQRASRAHEKSVCTRAFNTNNYFANSQPQHVHIRN